jgi:hypothetical protein
MALQRANTTCDIYRNINAPPAAPDVAGVKGYLTPDFAGPHRAAVVTGTIQRWTHVLLVPPATDVRDGYPSAPPGPGEESTPGTQDHVYVPDKNGTKFEVIFVERLGRGTAADAKRVYLQRQQMTWPSDDV